VLFPTIQDGVARFHFSDQDGVGVVVVPHPSGWGCYISFQIRPPHPPPSSQSHQPSPPVWVPPNSRHVNHKTTMTMTTAHIRTFADSHIHTLTRARIHAFTYTFTHLRTHAFTHSRVHALMRSRICTFTHISALKTAQLAWPGLAWALALPGLAWAGLAPGALALGCVNRWMSE
jgi:hypothetical protein